MAERRYRKFTAEQKLEIVIAGLKSGNVPQVGRPSDGARVEGLRR